MFVIKIAWRNILRHKRRSFFAMLTILTGVAGINLFGGFVEASYADLRESSIRSLYGHIQIHKTGYLANYQRDAASYRMSPALVAQVRAALATIPHVQITSQRLEFTGLIGNEKNSHAAIIRAGNPAIETLINKAIRVTEGRNLLASEPSGVLLGKGLAQSIHARVGDTLTLLGTTVNGVLNAVDAKVTGIFQSYASELDDAAMIMVLENGQTLLNTRSVDTIVVLLDDTMALPEVMASLTMKVQAQHLDIETIEWFKLAIFYQKVVKLFNNFFVFINLVIYVVVLFAVANTMIITVMERTFEIGTLRAMGTHRSSIVSQFLVEGLMLSLLGALLGVSLSIALTWLINTLHIMMPPPPGISQGYPLRILYVPGIWLNSIFAVALIAFFATLFPAVQASRKTIVDALRHV